MNELPTISSSSYQTGAIDLSGPWNELINSKDFINPHEDQFLKGLRRKDNIKVEEKMSERRIVQVFIADPDEKVPLKHALLYEGQAHLTDLTDQELFFEINIKEILDKHNALRITLKDKDSKEESYLDPVRIRDLKMTVVTIAEL